MSSIAAQRDGVSTLKKVTLLNVGLLDKLHPMSADLSRLLKENNLDKPTQNLFNHLAHYLVSIIDPHLTLPWPLYDTQTERSYRNELSVFITAYGNKGLLTPVMSSYLVNPGCYKVVNLMHQMSVLAVQRVLMTKMNKDCQKKLYNELTYKFKTQKEEGFIDSIEKGTSSKLLKSLAMKDVSEKCAKVLCDQITKNESKLKSYKAQEYIDNLVDGYIKTYNTLDNETKQEILEIKKFEIPAKFFDKCLDEIDKQMSKIESDWESKTSQFLKVCQTTSQNTETLIARQTGEADKRTFMVEYNPNADTINTEELEKLVNAQQKYILKNIVKEDKLNFPNLIRGFLISISFVLKNAEIDDEIYKFNQYLEEGNRSYREVVNAMTVLVERLMNAEGKLQRPQESFTSTLSLRDLLEIPPLPDLSDLKLNKEYNQTNHQIDTFTPINFSKHQFNLNKRNTGSFMKSLPKVFANPFLNISKDDFFKSLISCRVSAYDTMNSIRNTVNLNIPVMSQVRNNETIADCNSGFTKQQICRLLSTKKSSSSKKFKYNTKRPNIKIKKGGLFNESNFSNESIGVFRSHSSPNLYENRDSRFRNNLRASRLSIMKEDSPSLLEVSGIAVLERDRHSIPQGMISLESSINLISASSLPSVVIWSPQTDLSGRNEVDLNKEIEFKAPKMLPPRRSKEASEDGPVLHLRKSKLPQPTSKKALENQQVLPERKIIETPEKQLNKDTSCIKTDCSLKVEENAVLPKKKSKELIKEETVLIERKGKELYEEQTVLPQEKSIEFVKEETKVETPKTNPQIIKKTSSLEKIINRFKKLRASVLPSESIVETKDFNTIFEEKENLNSGNLNDVFTANRNLLPDLLSPSCSVFTAKSSNYDLEELHFDSDGERPRKRRESLGTALGVDHTFLDQFDLID